MAAGRLSILKIVCSNFGRRISAPVQKNGQTRDQTGHYFYSLEAQADKEGWKHTDIEYHRSGPQQPGGNILFSINDTVMYGSNGVCKIVDIRKENFNGTETVYYVLEPVDNNNSIIYCPVNADKIRIRRLLSEQEITKLIQTMPDTQTKWIDNDQQRKEVYTDIIKRGDHRELIQLLKTLHFKQEERIRAGKKFYLADERLMKEAENILHGEFAHVLHSTQDEVIPYIMGELEQVVHNT